MVHATPLPTGRILPEGSGLFGVGRSMVVIRPSFLGSTKTITSLKVPSTSLRPGEGPPPMITPEGQT